MQGSAPEIYGDSNAYLDNEHQGLLDLLDKLKPGSGVVTESRTAIAAELLAHLDAHFEHEEEVMERYQYPWLAEHKAVHRAFLVEAAALAHVSFATPNAELEPLVAAIERWIYEHLSGADACFAEFVRQYGSSKPAA